MQLRRALPFLIVAIMAVAPLAVHAASATFFGPIVPSECNCPGQAADFGCVLATLQDAINFGISLGIIGATIALAFAGFTWMTNATNPEKRGEGRNMLINVFVGLLILLSAWLAIDFLMKTIYNDGSDYGPWNSILGTSDSKCIAPTQSKSIGGIPGSVIGGIVGGSSTPSTPSAPPSALGTEYTYDPGIAPQMGSASGALSSLLSCMAPKLPSGVGRISSISDSAIQNGSKTFAQCDATGCAHTAHSCHYGGTRCVGQSYAVDFGDEQNATALRTAAKACNSNARYNYEGNHLHISVGAAASCGCDTGLPGV